MAYIAADGTEYRIADAHTHIYKQKIASKASSAIGKFYDAEMSAPEATAEALLERGHAIGCERYLVCSAATTSEQVDSINRFIADECTAHPEFVGLGTAHPEVPDFEALLDQAQELGLKGFKLHPDFQHFDIDDERMMPLYRGATERGLIMMFHVGDERYEFSAPEKLARVIDQIPGFICHAAHFGCCRIWRRRPLALEGAPVVYDTSSMLAWATVDEALELVERMGWEKLMWGTDFPMWDHRAELERFFALGLTPEQNRAILYDNFAQFYLSA